MNRTVLISGAGLGLLSVVLGAFAAHGLEAVLTAEALASFETGVRYQMYSSLFLLLLGGFPLTSEKVKKYCFYLTISGALLFSGSIYFLATDSLWAFDFRSIGWITPIGGSLLIAAWGLLLAHFLKLKKK